MPRKKPTKKPIDYTSRKYHEEGHAGHIKRNLSVEPDLDNFHPERDIICLLDAGIKFRDKREILVAGCGLGDDTYLLVEKLECDNVWGIDISRPAVDYWNNYFVRGIKADGSKASITRRTKGKAVRGGGSVMPFDDNRFDVVVTLDVTEHMIQSEYLLFLSNCYRVLKYDGICAVQPGLTKRPEHVNVQPMEAVEDHMRRVGFCTHPRGGFPWVIGTKRRTSVFLPEVVDQ